MDFTYTPQSIYFAEAAESAIIEPTVEICTEIK
jgi:hypothetical protein